MRVAIRTDAAPAIGLGHLQRCLALAQALRDGGAEVTFVTRPLGFDSASRALGAGFAVKELPAPEAPLPTAVTSHESWAGVEWERDAQDTVTALAGLEGLVWVVVDHYAFDARWHEAVARQTGARMAVIDDVADRPLACDLLIDHNYSTDHRAKHATHVGSGTPILGGPQFALLGPAYAQARRHEPRAQVGSIGIFMGGLDARGFSEVALRACRELAGFEGAIELAATSGNPHLLALEQAVRNDGKARLLLDLPDLADFFARHDLQVGAGGGATWERCCIGAPTIAIIVAENQRPVLEPLRDLGVLRTAEATADAIAAQVRALVADGEARKAMSARARQLVDGLGAGRVSRYMLDA